MGGASGVLGEEFSLQPADKNAGVARAHDGAHGYPAGLVKVVSAELEVVLAENEFGKAEYGGGRVLGEGLLLQEVLQGLEAICVRDAGVK